MAEISNDGDGRVRDLVDLLESHLHADEREFAKSIQITPEITDEALDNLFLDETFDRCKLLRQLSVTNLATANASKAPVTKVPLRNEDEVEDMQDIYLRQVEGATTRLRDYLDVLTN